MVLPGFDPSQIPLWMQNRKDTDETTKGTKVPTYY